MLKLNFEKGPMRLDAEYPSQIDVFASVPFSAWAYNDKEVISHLGPYSGMTSLRKQLPVGTTHVEIRIAKSEPWAWFLHPINHHKEIPDPEPVAVHLQKPPTLKEQIAQAIREELSRAAMDEGYETFEEADDFDVSDEDSWDLMTPYELTEMQEEYPLRGQEPEHPADPQPSTEQKPTDEGGKPRHVANPDTPPPADPPQTPSPEAPVSPSP